MATQVEDLTFTVKKEQKSYSHCGVKLFYLFFIYFFCYAQTNIFWKLIEGFLLWINVVKISLKGIFDFPVIHQNFSLVRIAQCINFIVIFIRSLFKSNASTNII